MSEREERGLKAKMFPEEGVLTVMVLDIWKPANYFLLVGAFIGKKSRVSDSILTLIVLGEGGNLHHVSLKTQLKKMHLEATLKYLCKI